MTVDDVSGSPNKGTIYVYYTLFCNDKRLCGWEMRTVPPFSSAILESHSPGAGLPFSAPKLVSGSLTQEQFSDMVIDSHGTPHIFFDDFTNFNFITMWESTLKGGKWVVSKQPVATFVYNGLNNIQWGFRDLGAVAPGCGIHGDTAYCAFSASQLAGGAAESTPSVYLAVVNTLTGASSIHRVNNDPFNGSKDHFFAWATATSRVARSTWAGMITAMTRSTPKWTISSVNPPTAARHSRSRWLSATLHLTPASAFRAAVSLATILS